jgi:hypothetical protein
MMQTMIRSPREGRTRAIEHGKKDQDLADGGMQTQRPMGEGSMVAHRGT